MNLSYTSVISYVFCCKMLGSDAFKFGLMVIRFHTLFRLHKIFLISTTVTCRTLDTDRHLVIKITFGVRLNTKTLVYIIGIQGEFIYGVRAVA